MTDGTAQNELDAALYDLVLLGCRQWRLADPTKTVTPLYPVLGALWRAGCYRNLLNRKLSTRGGLRDLVQLGSHVAHVEMGTKASPENMVAASLMAPPTAHLVIMVRPVRGNRLLQYDKVLGYRGYPCWLTGLGMVHAAELAERYPDLTERAIVMGAARFDTLRPSERQV